MIVLGIFTIIAGFISLILGLVVSTSTSSVKTRSSKWSFVLFASSVGVWSIGVGLFSLAASAEVATFAVYAYYIAALLIAYALLIFCISYTSETVSKVTTIGLLLPWIVMSFFILQPGLFIASISTVNHTVDLVPSMYALFTLIFISYTALGMVLLWRKALLKKRVQRFRVLAVWFTICLIGGGFFNLILPGFGYYQYIGLGPLFTFIMVTAVFYAIARHGLFDIRLAVVRTVTYLLSLVTLAGIYLIVIFLIFDTVLNQSSTISQITVNVFLTLVLAFTFQPIKRFFDKLTNRVFYQDNYNIDEFITELSRALSSTNDLHGLLRQAAEKIAYTMKSTDISFVVYTGSERSEQIGTGSYSRISYKDVRWLDDFIGISVVEPKVLSQLEEDDELLRRMMVSHRIAIILPLVRQGIKMGYLFLGDHKRSSYNARDIRVVRSIADELVIAIQNALTVEQIKELNAHLEQRVDAATKELRRTNAQLQKLDEAKDDFISMASHQLRTPLTSIKGYLSMMIEGDVGKISQQQEHVLNEAFLSSERMVRLISDFLNVSRLQTGKFILEKHPVDIALLIQREIDSLTQNATARGMKFIYKMPKNIPELDLDENKIQQVVMNFSDNALYYSKDNGKITITLKKIADQIEFIVKDNGIGVPEAEQAHLFNKFFRATNARRARPDGTGVGLFLAKKVIDAHDGEIIFESKEGKGSSFGFRLPLPKKK
ncbi:MAG: putative Histidine kinase [Candidatus Saccharibacteria bacterium]|nr:putative Histidine kinase [Candidatus Saccharibacteria bacterium]MDB5180441.1 putative Histidine kinase [Candidatus Saccharibacteria bacterium]